MKKSVYAAAFCTLVSGVALAHDKDCNIEFDHTLQVTPGYVSIVDAGDELYRITPDGILSVAGSEVTLTAEQQKQAALYAEGLRNESQQILLLAKEAVNIAVEGVTIAFDVLDIDRDEGDLADVLQEIDQRMAENWGNPEGTYSIGPDGISDFESVIGEPLGEELEEKLEDAIAGSVVKMVWNAFKLAFTDEEELEQRIEQKVADREDQIELAAEKLEVRAEGLCRAMSDLNLLEDHLRSEIPPMREHNLLRVRGDGASGVII